MKKLILLSIVCLASFWLSTAKGDTWCVLCVKSNTAVALLMEEHAHTINL